MDAAQALWTAGDEFRVSARGGDLLLGAHDDLDLTALGRRFQVADVPHHDGWEDAPAER